jgi:hypothetical protein
VKEFLKAINGKIENIVLFNVIGIIAKNKYKGANIMTDVNKIKESNPKDAVGIKKVPFSTVPAPVIAELALALLEGSRKYRRHNYRAIGVRASVYYDACLRHLSAFWEGEDIDPDSGISHITKATACLVVLRDAMFLDKCLDDRPPKYPDGWVNELNKKAKEIIEKYPKELVPYTEKNKNENQT